MRHVTFTKIKYINQKFQTLARERICIFFFLEYTRHFIFPFCQLNFCPSDGPTVYLSFYSVHLIIRLSVGPTVYLLVPPSICWFHSLSVGSTVYLLVPPSICWSHRLSVGPIVYLLVPQTIHFSMKKKFKEKQSCRFSKNYSDGRLKNFQF